MAFFKFRKGSDEPTAASAPAESLEEIRKRALRRLIGTAILVLLAVVGFPLLIDQQPRPVAVDIPIEIPDKAKVPPLVLPATATPPPLKTSPAQAATPPGAVVATAPPAQPKETTTTPSAAAKPADKLPAPTIAKPTEKPIEKAAEKPTPKAAEKAPADNGAKAQALLEGKEPLSPPQAAPGTERLVVQVGAYADAAKAREARLKLERAGFKTYTQVIGSMSDARTRVRVGPFATRAQADAAAEKIKKLDLPAAILTL